MPLFILPTAISKGVVWRRSLWIWSYRVVSESIHVSA